MLIHCAVKTLGARENNVQFKDAQTWVMLKTDSYKNKVASFAYQNALLFNYSAEVCVEYQCWFQQYKILIQVIAIVVLACVNIEVRNLLSSASSALLSPYIY